jgi:uncharacterized membrane protein
VLLALAACAWLFLLIAAPGLPAVAATSLYAAGSLICHQLPGRSFHIGATQLPVCARCLGIYSGAAVTTVVAACRRGTHHPLASSRLLLTMGAVPVAVTVLLEWGTVWQPSNVVRAMTGAILGAAVGMILANAAATLHYERCARRPSARLNPPAPPT